MCKSKQGRRALGSRAGGRQSSNQLLCCSKDGVVTVLPFFSPHALRLLMLPVQITEYTSCDCVPKGKSTRPQPIPHRACPITSARSHSEQFCPAAGLQSWHQSWDTRNHPFLCIAVCLINFSPLTQGGD